MSDQPPDIRPTFRTAGFEFSLRGALGAAAYCLAEPGEVLATAAQMFFTAAKGADGHCAPLAPGLFCQRVFDWLEETLAP